MGLLDLPDDIYWHISRHIMQLSDDIAVCIRTAYHFAFTHPLLWQQMSHNMYVWDVRSHRNHALHWAARYGHVATASRALEEGHANPNVFPCIEHSRKYYWCGQPLTSAVGHDHKAMVELLLRHGANINPRAIFEAVKYGNIESMRLLLDWGANLNIVFDWKVEFERNTPLIVAVKTGSRAMVELLLERGAEPNLCNSRKVLAIGRAVEDGHREIVELLLDSGKVDVNCYSGENNFSLLTIAAVKRHIELVKLLLHRGANIHARDSKNETVFITAQFRCKGPRRDVTKVLLKHGARLECHEDYIKYRRAAVQRGSIEILKTLNDLAIKFDPSISKDHFWLAMRKHRYQMADYLLHHDPNLSDWTNISHNSLPDLINNHQWALVEALLARSGPVDDTPNQSMLFHRPPTPLWLAVFHNNTSTTRLLLDKGSDPHIYSQKRPWSDSRPSRDPIRLALARANDNILDMLVDHYGNCGRDGYRAPLIAMIAKGNLTLTEKMLRLGFMGVDRNYDWLQPPLLVAIAKGREPFVRLLLEYGADANEIAYSHYDHKKTQKPRTGMSLLKYAAKKGHTNIADTLREFGAEEFDFLPLGEANPDGIRNYVKKYPASAGKEDVVYGVDASP